MHDDENGMPIALSIAPVMYRLLSIRPASQINAGPSKSHREQSGPETGKTGWEACKKSVEFTADRHNPGRPVTGYRSQKDHSAEWSFCVRSEERRVGKECR